MAPGAGMHGAVRAPRTAIHALGLHESGGGAHDDAGGRLTLTRVVPGSPAEAAGLRAGDVLVALNGTPFGRENEAKVKASYTAMTPGAKITYTVQWEGKDREVEITLGKLPSEVMAQWVGAQNRRVGVIVKT